MDVAKNAPYVLSDVIEQFTFSMRTSAKTKQIRKYPIVWFSNCLLFICIEMASDSVKTLLKPSCCSCNCVRLELVDHTALLFPFSRALEYSILFQTIQNFGMQVLSSLRSMRLLFGFSAPYWVPMRVLFYEYSLANALKFLYNICKSVPIVGMSSLISKFLLGFHEMLCTNW